MCQVNEKNIRKRKRKETVMSLRADLHLEVTTFEAQTFITPAFKKSILVSYGFQIGSINFGA